MVDCEPAVRFIINKVFVNSLIIIACDMPAPFEHLVSSRVTLRTPGYIQKNLELVKDYKVLCSFEHETRPVHGLNQPLMHGVDFASLHLLGYLLPEKHRRVFLSPPSPQEKMAISLKFQELGLNADEVLLIHPGQSWETRTIPLEWWEAFLEAYPYPVCMIGSDDNRFYQEKTLINGMLPLKGVVSLVDKLTTRGAIVATAMTWGVMTNDSFPLHIAGAFNNYLFTFSTVKEWEFLKPYDHPRSFNFGRNLFTPEWYSSFNKTVHFNKFPDGIDSILPFIMPPEEAANFIASCYEGVC